MKYNEEIIVNKNLGKFYKASFVIIKLSWVIFEESLLSLYIFVIR